MSDAGLVLYAVVAFMMSILSGATGGGGGFLLTPLMIFLGLSPAQAVASGKFGGIAVSLGSLRGLKGHKPSDKRLVLGLMVAAIVIGLIAPRLIINISPESYKTILGILLIFASPFIIYKKIGHAPKKLSKTRKYAGVFLAVVSMFLVSIFSGGIGIFINISLMAFVGMSSIDAAVTKRLAQLVLNVLIVIGLIGSGLFVWKVILVTIVFNGIGGFIGGKKAIKKGAKFVSTLIAIAAFCSGVALLLS